MIYLDPRETFPLRELLMAMTIKSANDAAYQVGDFLSNGDLPAFVAEMNTRAFELGMPGTHFINPHGLPDRQGNNSRSSAVGMVLLGEALLQYPQVMEWASTRQTFIRNGKTELTNTNNLFRRMHCPGVDGLKTGYTRAAGFCLTFTCLRNGRRLIGVVTGAARARERDDFAFALLNWGYGR